MVPSVDETAPLSSTEILIWKQMTVVSHTGEVERHEQPPTIVLLELRKSCWLLQIYDKDLQ